MHPILLEFGPIRLFTYGFFLALAFLSAIFIGSREAKRLGLPVEKFYDLCFYAVVGALVGSRLLYVILDPRPFLEHPLKIFALWEGGLDFQGGLFLALAVAFYYIRRHKLPWRTTLDALALGLPVGQFFGRIGCFMAGCCYGSPSHLPWAVTFTNPQTLCPLREPLHPAQLYEAFLSPGGLRGAQCPEDQETLRRPGDPGLFLPGRTGALRGGVLPEPHGLSRPHDHLGDAPDPGHCPGSGRGERGPAGLFRSAGGAV